MIVKYREIPDRLLQLEVLARWLPKNHPQYSDLLDEIGMRRAGLYGEQNLDYHMRLVDAEKYCIFQGIRLIGEFGAFQIDSLVLSTNFILIIEVKNFADEVHFDKNFNQVIRKSRKRGNESFQDPIAQAHKHEIQLKQYIKSLKIKMPPIDSLVCISNSSTIITADDQNTRAIEKVFHAEHVIEKITNIEKKYPVQVINHKTLQKLSKYLLAGHTPLKEDIFNTYDVSKVNLVKGVRCPRGCNTPMIYKSGYWFCISCNFRSKDAYMQTIYDHLLLINPTITNAQSCELLDLPSRNVAYKLLKKMNLSSIGMGKGRKYFLPKDGEGRLL